MTKEMVMAMLATIKDISVDDDYDDMIAVTIEDFEGFDEDWGEICKKVDASVKYMEAWLDEHCVSQCHDYYSDYEFEGFTVQVGSASMDI